jgi:glutathione S-transferase
VWIALEEKRIPYRIEKINMRCYGDKPASFSRMQPSGQIPVAVIDGVVYGQSNDILARLEQEDFPFPSLLRPKDEPRARELLRLERTVFGAWMNWLTSSPSNKREFVEALKRVEAALKASSGPFFLGDSISIVDIQFAPFLERMAASMLYYKGFVIRVAPGEGTDFPNINKWYVVLRSW